MHQHLLANPWRPNRSLLALFCMIFFFVTPGSAKTYTEYQNELATKEELLTRIPREKLKVLAVGSSGALFYCHPYCEWVSFFGPSDKNIYWKKEAPLKDGKIVLVNSPEFKLLFPDAPTTLQNPLETDSNEAAKNAGAGFDRSALDKAAGEAKFSFHSKLGLFYGPSDVASDSSIEADGTSGPFIRYQAGFFIQNDNIMTLMESPWVQIYDFDLEKTGSRASKNGSGNSSSVTLMRANYFLINVKNEKRWGPFVGLWQTDRQYQTHSFQAIATKFQELWIGGRFATDDWKIDLGTNLFTMAKDEDAFRTSPQDFKRLRLEVEKCFGNVNILGGRLTYCGAGVYEASQESTQLSNVLNPSGGSAKFLETSWGVGMKLYYGGANND